MNSVDADVVRCIGNTPMVEVTRIDTGLCRLFLKLENQNPGGSIKDRIGQSMIRAAERGGQLRPGGILVEATAGNTGLGLALFAALRGYRLILVIPDKMSREKVLHLKALGAEVIMTRSDVGKGHPAYYHDLAEEIAKRTPGAFYINQFNNPANPLAHETTTGPEIWAQSMQQLDAVVCGVGSGGTMTGLLRFFRRVAPEVELVLADPTGSILADYVHHGSVGTAGSWLVEGIGEDFLPPLLDLEGVRRAYSISDGESFAAARLLLQKEGILGGSSSGTLLAAALRYCREQKEPKRVVTFVCDSGNKYLSKLYDDFWMADEGFLPRENHGDLRDLVSRRFSEGAVVSAKPDEPLSAAYTRMRRYDISQLPVIEEGRIVGLVDESDVLLCVEREGGSFGRPVHEIMTTKLQMLPPKGTIAEVQAILAEGMVAIIADESGFYGLITRMDLLRHFRRQASLASA